MRRLLALLVLSSCAHVPLTPAEQAVLDEQEDAELQAHAEANPNATLDCVVNSAHCATNYLDREAADRHARGYAAGLSTPPSPAPTSGSEWTSSPYFSASGAPMVCSGGACAPATPVVIAR